MYTLGIDIGGTNTVVGVVDEKFNILSEVSFKTLAPRSAQSLCDDISRAAHKAAEKAGIDYSEISAAGADSPGVISKGICEFANNLGFVDIPLEKMIGDALGIPAVLSNDGNAAAYGEFVAGCGRGKKSLAMLTIGTGIGGGFVSVIDGKVSFDDFGAEMGHFVVNSKGRKCSCGSQGCIEAYCSATALINDTRKAMRKHPESLLWQVAPSLSEVDGRTVFAAAEMSDKTAEKVLQGFINYLAIGVYNIIVLFRPDVICVGGGMSREGERLLSPVRKIIEKNPLGSLIGKNTEIRAAELFGDAGLIGAAALATTLEK